MRFRSIVLCFRKGFSGFPRKVTKLSKTPENPTNHPDLLYPMFFLFSRFFFCWKKIHQKQQKPRENKQKHTNQKTKWQTPTPQIFSIPWVCLLHDVRPGARWWLQFIYACSTCVSMPVVLVCDFSVLKNVVLVKQMTVLAYCHGRPFWFATKHMCAHSLWKNLPFTMTIGFLVGYGNTVGKVAAFSSPWQMWRGILVLAWFWHGRMLNLSTSCWRLEMRKRLGL